MDKLISSLTHRETRHCIIRSTLFRACLNLDPVSAAALAIPLPTLAAITVTRSGLLLIGPPEIIKHCRDPVSS